MPPQQIQEPTFNPHHHTRWMITHARTQPVAGKANCPHCGNSVQTYKGKDGHRFIVQHPEIGDLCSGSNKPVHTVKVEELVAA